MKFHVLLGLVLSAASAFAQRTVQRTYDLIDVNWSVTLDEKTRSIRGDVTNTLTPLRSLNEVRFDSARLVIDKVTVDGEPANFTVTGDALIARLPQTEPQGKRVAVRIVYHGKPEAGIYFVPVDRSYPATTPVVYTQGEMEDTRYWLPTYDFPDDKATSEARINVPKGWNVLSNGRLEEAKASDDRVTYHWKTEQPHSTYLISLVAGPYSAIQDDARELPVSYWVPIGLEEQGKAAFGGTASQILIYEQLTGYKYPFAKFAQSAVPDFMFGGMENVSAVTQTITTLHPARLEPLENSEGLVAHELAHQWFGDTVTSSDWAHIWINEGFASFMPAFVARAKRGEEDFGLARSGVLDGAYAAMKNEKQPMIWNRYKDAFERFGGNSYEGGAARLFMLLRMVGEEPFWRGVNAFLRKFEFKNATTEDFFAVMSESTVSDLEEFRKQWFYQAAVPTITVKRDAQGFVISQDIGRFSLPIEYIVSGGPLQKATLGASPLSIAAPANARILVDPECWLLAKVNYDLDLDAAGWFETYRLAPIAAQKLRILAFAQSTLSLEQKTDLLKQEDNAPIRAAILRSIQDVPTLLPYISDADARIRLAAIEALGSSPKDSIVVDRLTQIADDEPNDVIRLAAIQTLVKQTEVVAWVEKAYRIEGHQDRFRTWALGWYADHDKVRARDLALSVVASPPTETLRQAALRVLGRVKDRPGERLAFGALTKVLMEDSVGGVRAAIDGLQSYGSRDAIPFLMQRQNHGLHFIRNDIKRAMEVLRG